MVVAIGEPLIAPVSGRPCVYYETASEKRGVVFLADDGSGVAVVDPRSAELLLDGERESIIAVGERIAVLAASVPAPATASTPDQPYRRSEPRLAQPCVRLAPQVLIAVDRARLRRKLH